MNAVHRFTKKQILQRRERHSQRHSLHVERLEDRRVLNSVPLLDPAKSPELTAVIENAGAPVGQIGTLVSELIDTGGPLNNFSDADGDLPGIAITGTNLRGGTLWYSVDAGGTWHDVGAVSGADPRLLAADADSRLYYQPAADFTGTVGDVISFKAWDRTSRWQQLGLDIDGEAAGDGAGVVSLSADGQTVAIRAAGNDGNGEGAGHTRIYRWNGLAWSQLGVDIDGEAGGDGGGGVSLSADGQTVAIGASSNDGNGFDSGHVRVYSWTGSSWRQLGGDINGERSRDYSGHSVSLSADGRTVAIGAPYNNDNGTYTGQVRIYSWTGSSWRQLGNDINGEAVDDKSGQSVSLSDDGATVAIGAHFNQGSHRHAGHVRVYSWDGAAWNQLGDDIDGEASYDYSGHAVSLSSDGRIVAIGAPDYGGTSNHQAGSVHVYAWTGSSWSQLGSDIDGEAIYDFLGTGVSLAADGQTLAIGASNNDGNGNDSGHTRIYSWTGSAWSQIGEDIDGEAAGDYSGSTVSLSSDGQTVAIGARGNDGNGVGSGHTRIYQSAASLSAFTDTISVTVDLANQTPTDISLSAATVVENAARGTEIGKLSTTDDNADDSFTYTLVSGPGGTDNASFEIGGDAIRAGEVFDYEAKNVYAIRVRSTDAGGLFVDKVFTITVTNVNEAPSLNVIQDLQVDEDAGQQSVTLTGVTSGDDVLQPVRITATSSNPGLIPTPSVTYASADATGSLAFTPVADRHGTASIMVTAEDGGLDGDLATAGDNVTFSRMFDVTVTPINDEPTLEAIASVTLLEGAAEQVLNLSGISAGGGEIQPLRVTATSSNPGLIPNPPVAYASSDTTGSIAFTPLADQHGTATITVTVEDGGLDGDLATVEDNVTVSRSFSVTVMPAAELTLLDLVVAAGAEFSVPITTSDVPGLQSVGLTLNFDASVLEAVSVTAGSLTSGWVVAANTSVAGQVAVSLVNQAPVDGSGTLAAVTFRAIGSGGTSTNLALGRHDLNDGAIPSRVTAGTVSVRQPTLSGAVRYFGNNGPVAGAELTLTSAGGPLQTVTTQANGRYTFTGVASGSQEVSASMSGGTEAISAYDAALVLQHDVGLRTLSGQQQVAADTDGNSQVTLMDAARILAKSVGLISGYFPNQTSDWVFEPETRTVSVDAGDLTGQDFVGMVLGDVSGNWRTTGLVADPEVSGAVSFAAKSSASPAFGSLAEPTRVVLGSRDVLPGTTLSLPLEITGFGQGMLALDAVVTFDPTNLSIDPADIQASQPGSVSVVANLVAPGQLKLAVASGTPLPTNEELASLPFTVTGLTGATEVAIQTAALNEGLIDSRAVSGGFAALTPIETDGVVVLSKNNGGALYAGNTRLAYEGGDVTERFLNRWAVLAADETPQGPAVLLKHNQDAIPKHRLRADDAWALYGVFEGLGNAISQTLTPAARGRLAPDGGTAEMQQELLRKVIESAGRVTLSRDTLGILYANETAIAFGGVATVMGWPAGSQAQYVWPAIAAETVDGTNRLLLRQPEGESYATFTLDASWQRVARISETSMTEPDGQAQLWDDEAAFGIDIDLDGKIGMAE